MIIRHGRTPPHNPLVKANAHLKVLTQKLELGRFEALRTSFLSNKVGTEFLDAQQEMSRLQENIFKHLQKTVELGRVPTVEDMNDGSCCSGHGCGCD